MINIFIEGLPSGKMANEIYSSVLLEEGINPAKIDERKDLILGTMPVHFTVPNDVNPAAEFYCNNNLPFIMGTTGGDREVLEERVKNSNISAVIDTNMAKDVVNFRNMLRILGYFHPDCYARCSFKIVESHPGSKKDGSGTALSMKPLFNKLGIPDERITTDSIRKRKEQLEMGVPEEALDSHAWHQYFWKEKGQWELYHEHKFNDRVEYVKGTIKAIRFLNKKIKQRSVGKVYTMEDVYGFI